MIGRRLFDAAMIAGGVYGVALLAVGLIHALGFRRRAPDRDAELLAELERIERACLAWTQEVRAAAQLGISLFTGWFHR